MKYHLNYILAATLGFSSVTAALADDAHHPSASAQAVAANVPMADGEIRKVDKAAGKLTIKHGALTNLDMPAMTMVFRVKDVAVLDQIKPGDKISFIAERVNGQFTVTQLEVKK